MRLLVVEDEIKTGDYLRQGLAEAGFQVSLVRNGLDGHHLAMTESFDLIVLDVMLPDVDGWRIVQSLREALTAARVSEQGPLLPYKGIARRPLPSARIVSMPQSGLVHLPYRN